MHGDGAGRSRWRNVWIAIALALAPATAGAGDVAFPGKEWARKEPAELGLDPARLDGVATDLGSRGCFIKDGYVVKSWGSQSERGDWASSAKPVLSTLLMFAVEEGKVTGFDQPLVDLGWPLAAKDRGMTFRHLANMMSGYARPEAPGEAWAYNDYAIQLYQQSLFDKVYKADPAAVFHDPARFGALGIQDGFQFRPTNRRMRASVRDFARVAWLWLNRGRWGDRQLLPRAAFDEALRPHVPRDLPLSAKAKTDDYLKIGTYGGDSNHFSDAGPGIYGFNWWFNARGKTHPDALTWPDAPPDAFMSLGVRGNCSAMIPGLRVVVVAAAADWGELEPGKRDAKQNLRLRRIVEAGTPVARGK